jgi:hypothetical protein
VRYIRFFAGGTTGLQWEAIDFVDGREPYMNGPFPDLRPDVPLPEDCAIEPLTEAEWILARLSI